MLESAVFQITHKCNSDCDFCLNIFWNNRSNPDLSFEEKKYVIYRLFEAGITQLVLSGGEPLVDKNCVDLVNFGYGLGLDIIIQTNGLLINKEFLGKTKGKALIQVSLEGREHIHNAITMGNFKRTVKSINLVRSMGLPLFTNFTITKKNLHELPYYIKIIEKLGINIANFTRLYPVGKALVNFNDIMPSKDEFLGFLKELDYYKSRTNIQLNLQGPTPVCILTNNNIGLKTSSCAAGKTEINITPEGDISFCPSWPETEGNIRNVDLTKIPRISLRHRLPEKCKSCSELDTCGGACILACTKDGDIYSENGLKTQSGPIIKANGNL